MTRPALLLSAMAALLLAAVVFAVTRQARAPVHPQMAEVSLISTAITLPEEHAAFPAGAAGELLGNNCAACHSAELIRTQPRLSPEAWAAEVKKMREAYHAPYPVGDDPALVAALLTLPGQRAR